MQAAKTYIESHGQMVHRWVHAQCQLINARIEDRGAMDKKPSCTIHRFWSNPISTLNASQVWHDKETALVIPMEHFTTPPQASVCNSHLISSHSHNSTLSSSTCSFPDMQNSQQPMI